VVLLKQISKKHTRILILILLIIVSIFIGNFIFNKLIGKPYIGIIKIEGSITSESKKDSILELIESAKENRNIKAVVLGINSPGGGVVVIEEIYLSLLELRKEKPIVSSIDQIGASGAYYIAITSNYIYAKPSSDIGGIGVISILPDREPLDENIITTGTLKGVGTPRKEQTRQIQMIQESFLRAVLFQRGDKLKLSKEELANAKVYIGFDALNFGLIDALGTKEESIEKAAKLARITNYEVIDLDEESAVEITVSLSVDQSILNGSTNTVPMNYYLYLNPEK